MSLIRRGNEIKVNVDVIGISHLVDSVNNLQDQIMTNAVNITTNDGEIAAIQLVNSQQQTAIDNNAADIAAIETVNDNQQTLIDNNAAEIASNDIDIANNTARLDNLQLSDNNDAQITTPAANQLLSYNGAQWVNQNRTATSEEILTKNQTQYITGA